MIYSKFWYDVLFVLNSADPVGLIGGGAPQDEYASECDMIISSLKACETSEDLSNSVLEIFKRQFGGVEIDLNSCKEIGGKVWILWQKKIKQEERRNLIK